MMHSTFFSVPVYIWLVILVALAFDFANGWHDTANSVATAISTRVLKPYTAIAISAVLNFAGALLSTKVAKTIGGGIVDPRVVSGANGEFLILAAMSSAILWEIFTVLEGLPVSGSHALIGGLIGGAISLYGIQSIQAAGVLKIFLALLISPVLGFGLGFVVLKISYFFAQKMKPVKIKMVFSSLQIFTSSSMSLMHGQNDAQKVMGVITLLLFTAGYFGKVDFKAVHVPIWVMLACGFSMAMGTAMGGRAVIKTLGKRLSDLKPIDGASAEFTASLVLEGASLLGLPVSTTHTITGSIVGVGTARRLKGVKWGVGIKIIYAWLFTLPVTALLSALIVQAIMFAKNKLF